MFHNKHKLQCHEKEIITLHNEKEQERSPKKDVELCLEVEMDDEVREIITSPDKCMSTLLDVTVIKPKDIDIDQVYTTQKRILNGDEVRKLITIMELEKQDKQRLINQILSKDERVITIQRHNNPKSAGDYVKNKHFEKPEKKVFISPKHKHLDYLDNRNSEFFFEHMQKICSTDETNSDICSDRRRDAYKQSMKSGDHERVQQIYTTPRAYNDIKSIFTCKNKHRYEDNEKPNRPCTCQNCAIVGVLTDSQKRPFITEELFDPREFPFGSKKESKENKAKRKKSVNFRDENHLECHYYFKHLSAKIKDLEERLALQEERSVPKDYFKRIITKLVAHISKLTSYGNVGSQDKLNPQKCKEYKDLHKTKDKIYGSYNNNNNNKDKIYGSYGAKYNVHPVLTEPKSGRIPAEKEFSRIGGETPTTSFFSPTNPTPQPYDGLWKWGEEILKPGIDLKNKIVVLLEETIQSLKKPKEHHSKVGCSTKLVVDESSKNIPKACLEVPVRDINKKPDQYERSQYSRHSNHSNSISNVSDAKTYDRKSKRLLPKIFSKRDFLYEEPLNVSYMNPKLSTWQEESLISFKFESDIESIKQAEEKKLNEGYKTEFLDTLSNTKEADKLTLWQSIWNQAQINGQTKQDKVTIQIPDRKNMKNHKIIEIEYTIAELEKLLTNKVDSQQNEISNKKKL